MPKFKDPIEIYRESLSALPPRSEEGPPVILRAEVWPYPDLTRLWVRLETSQFVQFPSLAFTVYDSAGVLVSSLYMVEFREPYQSLTIHLRQAPRAGERYRLDIELSRDEAALDRRELSFDLVYREPQQG